jgi:coenzyme F420-reducing hydrogenase alpha subunit
LRWAREAALETVRWVSGFEFPDLEVDCELVSLADPAGYPLLGSRIRSTGGLDIGVSAFDEHFVEEQVAHSTALHARMVGRGRYLVGPLARYSLSSSRLAPVAREAAREAGLGEECRNPFRSIVVRSVEVLHACDEALRLIEAYEPPDHPWVEVEPREAMGHGCTEAPRGVLYHRYRIGPDGLILEARIVPPTSQNQAQIEQDLRRVVEGRTELPTPELTGLCERAIRSHDPCISCATHFLDLRVDRA